jgi:ATP-binding cassette ChvD family protein
MPATDRVPAPTGAGVATCRAVSEENYIYTMYRMSKSYGGGSVKVLENVNLAFYPGAKIGVLGYNGAGKSTVLKIMAGIEQPSSGDAILAPGARVGLLEQEPQLDPAKDVLGNVEEGVAETRSLLTRYGELSGRLGESLSDAEMTAVMDEFTNVQEAIERANAWDLDRQLEVAMDALRLPPGDADVTTLSGGERRRVALCRLLLSAPDLLLLDEPTNHLDAESVAWLERFLDEYPGTVVGVTHDRYFLDNVAGWILELDRGKGIPWKGNYSSWLEQKEARLAQEDKESSARRTAIARELEWVRSGQKARQAKGKARLANYERLVAEEADTKARGAVEIRIPPAPRLGDLVVEASSLRKGFGDRVLIDDLSFSLPKAGIVGVIGPNGAGKTTLFRMIAGQEEPDGGALTVGETVQLAYVDQARDELDPANTVWKEISDGRDVMMLGGKVEVNSRAYVASFNFKGADQQKPVGQLSGGERNRVHLAKMLAGGGNLLLLDEPSNDLDVDTLRALEDAVEAFSGCAVIISHDRWFLDRIATHILAFEGEGEVLWFEGNYAEYEEHRKRTLGDAAAQPHRMKYKRLTDRSG